MADPSLPTILFLHENYPAQFGILADHLAHKGWRVVYATQKDGIEIGKPITTKAGVKVLRYSRARDVSKNQHVYLRGTESAVLNAQGFARMGAAMRREGFMPDIVVAHSGWGSGSFAKVVWPDARFVQYLEWWYKHPAVDVPPVTLHVGFSAVRPHRGANRISSGTIPGLRA